LAWQYVVWRCSGNRAENLVAAGFSADDMLVRDGTGGDEGDAGIGALLAPGAPSGAVFGGSIRNACFRAQEPGEFTAADLTALTALYGVPFHRALTAWDQPEGGWAGYALNVVDVSGDGRADLVWNFRDSINRTYVDLAVPF
jgi:hypothetical protein